MTQTLHDQRPAEAAVRNGDRAPDTLPERVRQRWTGMSGKLGLLFAGLGFVLIAVAWNGAAGLDYPQGQLPYLISGGVSGLGLIIVGSALLIVENARRDRALLERRLELLASQLARGERSAGGVGASGDLVVAGRMSFHHPSCHLVDGRDETHVVPRDRAEAAGLTPCRVCNP
jgi:hypothetical protein